MYCKYNTIISKYSYNTIQKARVKGGIIVLHRNDEPLEIEEDTYTCTICEDIIVLDDKTITLPKCRICNEPQYYENK